MQITPYNIQKAIRYLKHYGFREFLIRLREKQEPENISYQEYYQAHKLTKREWTKQRRESDKWAYRPLISFVLICKDGKEKQLAAAEAVLTEQSYTNWELCSKVLTVRDISVCNIRKVIEEAGGEYIAFIEAGDMPEASACYELAEAVRNQGETVQSGVHWEKADTPDIIYTDEDNYVTAQFKPDYSPALLEEYCYIRHLFAVRKEFAAAIEMQQCSSPDAFILHCACKTNRIIHIPKVLYHVSPDADSEDEKHTQAVSEYKKPPVSEADFRPLISIIIPNKDEKESLKTCLMSVERSSYPNYEVIIVENNSKDSAVFDYYKKIQRENDKVRVIRWESEGSFNYSAINNCGAAEAKGEYLVFLNNDIEIITADWMEVLLAQCRKEHVAAAGAKLYYPDDTVQHAGIIIGIGGHARGVAANMCVGLSRKDSGYMKRASVRQNMSAVTAACMMMKRSVFEEVGGFTEQLRVAFNDVDLCLKARKAGYLIVYEPYAEAYHYESKSRGMEDTKEKLRRFQSEIEYMRTEWNDILRDGDPYYNPNLTRYRTDYSLRAR